MRNILKGSALPLGLSLLAACSQTLTTATISDVCLIWTPVTYSAKGDTPETVEGIRALNARRDAYCTGK